MKLTGKNTCIKCGKDLIVRGLCEINTDNTFYGGRVKFFNNTYCECGRRYKLCITETEDGIQILDSYDLGGGLELVSTKIQPVIEEKAIEEAPTEVEEPSVAKEPLKNDRDAINEEAERRLREKANRPNFHEMNKQRKQAREEQMKNVLATLPGIDEMRSKMMLYTKQELIKMCNRKKIKISKVADSKETLINKLIFKDNSN